MNELKYYIIVNDKTMGPLSLNQVERLYKFNKINEYTKYSTENSTDWIDLEYLIPLFGTDIIKSEMIPPIQQPTIVINNSNNQGYYPISAILHYKSRIIYQLLAFFFGILGIHNFYADRNVFGYIQLFITLLSCGYFAIFSFIWSIIEIFIVYKDGNNIPMR